MLTFCKAVPVGGQTTIQTACRKACLTSKLFWVFWVFWVFGVCAELVALSTTRLVWLVWLHCRVGLVNAFTINNF
jgi:hypothetical protein